MPWHRLTEKRVCSTCAASFNPWDNSRGLFCSLHCLNEYQRNHRVPIKFSPQAEQLLFGSILGDASISRSMNIGNPCVWFKHSVKDYAYVLHKHQILTEAGAVHCDIKVMDGKARFYTVRHPYFRELSAHFYSKEGRIVSNTVLEHLSSMGIAYWYEDDGCLCKYGQGYELKICTNSFTFATQKKLQDWFQDTYGLEFKIHSSGNGTLMLELTNRLNVDRFLGLVSPYILPCMNRKLGEIYA